MHRHHILAEIRTAGRSFVRQLLPSSTSCTLRYNGVSTAYLTVKDSHPVVAEVIGDGARATVWMVSVEGNNLSKHRLLEGAIGDVSGSGPFGTVTIPVRDDFDWFSQILGWQKPTGSLTTVASTMSDAYASYTGPSETRALAAVAANATRLALPWDVPVSLGRGTVGTTEFRMHALDRIVPALTADRLQLTLERNPATDRWVVGISEGVEYARPLTPLSGVLSGWAWQRQRPKATRMVIGGAGQDEDREFALVVDAAREAQLARIIEGFDDSRMADAGASLVPYGQESLTNAEGKSGVTATLRETSWFRFPGAFDLGTKVTVQAGAMTAHDVISEIEISHNSRDGFAVVPRVGFAVNEPQARLTKFVAELATSVHSLERR